MEKNWGKHWKEEVQNSLTHQWAWFYFYGNELITANIFFKLLVDSWSAVWIPIRASWITEKKNFEQNIQSQMITKSHRLISCLSTLYSRVAPGEPAFPWHPQSVMLHSAKKKDHGSEIESWMVTPSKSLY